MVERVKRMVPRFPNAATAAKWGQQLVQNIVEGEQYTAILKLVPSTRLDTKAVKSEMGGAWYQAHSTTSESIRIETIRRAA